MITTPDQDGKFNEEGKQDVPLKSHEHDEDATNDLSARIDQFSRNWKVIEQKIKHQLFPWLSVFNQLSETIRKTPPSFLIQMHRFAVGLAKFEVNERKVLKKLAKSGWIFIPWWTFAFYREIVKVGSSGRGIRNIARLITHYYTDVDTRVTERHFEMWCHQAFFRPWKRHLKQAITAHYSKQYALSIPVFLLVGDGICSEALKSKEKTLNRGTQFKNFKITFDPFLTALQKTSETFPSFVDMVLEKMPVAGYKKPRERRLYRHGIMHGKIKNYDRAEISARAIQLLDVIYAIINESGITGPLKNMVVAGQAYKHRKHATVSRQTAQNSGSC